ncbi:hypothetical protein EKE94_10685 [Mesobaculum littorinae]|uniref:AAA+ ATPase domain-containing protein n=1 Tax=Mesobaculum littorinae TaxID=2486419 RepID=A0A438AGW3_9RHOB|nr:TniB family NTP-binding protein [Mesobaculum littorinae]RVV97928.1 hypothetical protein EKE94_10685 [Mesobaculum littorinae]
MTSTALPLLSQIVRHDAFERASAELEVRLAARLPNAGGIIPLLGPTRVGKSQIMRRLVDRAEPAHSLIPMKKVIRAKLPAQTNGREIYAAILNQLGRKPGKNEVTSSVKGRVYRGIENLGIEVVVLDEVNHIAERGSNLSPRAAADHLKTLIDETGITLILDGLPRFQRIIDQNEQLRDRASGTILLKPYDWQADDDREAFGTAADAAIVSLEESGFPVAMEFEDFVRRLYGASGGRVPMMMRILKLCALGKSRPGVIDLRDFHKAASSMQQSGIPTASFFETREPDEVDLMRSYVAIMAEAGLEYRIDSLPGLGVEWGAQVG